MFTGIVQQLGLVKALRRHGAWLYLDLAASLSLDEVKIGDSISVNGVCLTVVRIQDKILSFDVMPQTVQTTTLKSLKHGDRVNIEPALKVGDRLGGHFVTGHVDCVGVIRSKRLTRGNTEVHIGVPSKFLKYLIPKGSVAVDGISLTISDVKRGGFSVGVIPHTLKATTLGFKTSSAPVNIEFDFLVKARAKTP
ncbi:MAG: riboflavin synthase [Candidatus Omnitrophota bacterium]